MGLLYQGRKRFASDGLNSLKYKVNKVEMRPLYTWVYVEINEMEVKKVGAFILTKSFSEALK